MEEKEKEAVEEDIEALKRALEEEKKKAEKYLDNWKRAEADLINYKKRAQEEMEEVRTFANAVLVGSLLPILDDLERALENVSTKLAGFTWVDGIRLIYKKLKSTLEAHGLEEIRAEGEDFDPHLHEAVMYEEGEEGKVLLELQKGYKFKGRVIRPSLVKVGKGKKEG